MDAAFLSPGDDDMDTSPALMSLRADSAEQRFRTQFKPYAAVKKWVTSFLDLPELPFFFNAFSGSLQITGLFALL